MFLRVAGPFQENTTSVAPLGFASLPPSWMTTFFLRRRTSQHIACWVRVNGSFPGMPGGACRGSHNVAARSGNDARKRLRCLCGLLNYMAVLDVRLSVSNQAISTKHAATPGGSEAIPSQSPNGSHVDEQVIWMATMRAAEVDA